LTEFERRVADALEEILEQEAAKKDESSTLREYFRGELARRVASAIETTVMAERQSCTANRGRHPSTRAWHETAIAMISRGARRQGTR